MRWLVFFLLVLAVVGTCVAPLMLAVPGLDWLEDARGAAVAFALLAGTWVCASLLVAYEKYAPDPDGKGSEQ